MKPESTRRGILYVCLCLTVAGFSVQAPQRPKDCLAQAQTQTEMTQCAGAGVEAAERELTETYQSIVKQYADQPLFLERMQTAQTAWLKYRDAQIEMRFPTSARPSEETEHGSAYPMCYAEYKAELTQRRTQELRQWLTGIQEGSVCSGSVKTHRSVK
jgi:uncharacterized protein YecT (DUF1311 family)